ncbi:cytochrome c-type biogenesis protein CcmH [Cardiobacteriaceae bacterium TAE3-ERU3]|nr:cytochrome c-type biogenesis protein CcmH [Cardiobacteriaceae bacterium TAE3-ERU3]
MHTTQITSAQSRGVYLQTPPKLLGNIFKAAALFVLALLSTTLWAAIDDAPEFSTPEQEAQYYALIKEIRCPTCQNNNVAESNAPLARQLRQQIAEQIQQGKNNSEISSYLVDRYGDFITYRPPFNARTWLLWLAPAGLMLIALIVWLIVRGRQRQIAALSPEQQAELRKLLMENRSPSKATNANQTEQNNNQPPQ